MSFYFTLNIFLIIILTLINYCLFEAKKLNILDGHVEVKKHEIYE